MSGKLRQQAPEPSPGGTASVVKIPDGDEPLLATLERAIDELERGARASREAHHEHGFLVGEVLGLVYWRRCRGGEGPHGLALLVERMLAAPAGDESGGARRALFSGFCWQLEQILQAQSCAAPDAHRETTH